MHDSIGADRFDIVAVAFDESAEASRPWVEAADPRLRYQVVVDTSHVVAERYGIDNVPTTVWIDEDGMIAKPPSIAMGDARFKDFTQLDSSIHHAALRRWVHEDEAPDLGPLRAGMKPRTEEQQLALAHRRVAAWLHSSGRDDACARHLARAAELSPMDWTIRRGGLPLLGGDPFGAEFFEFVQEWNEAGRPGY